MEGEAEKDLLSQDEKLQRSLRPVTGTVRKEMSRLADLIELYCSSLEESGITTQRVTELNSEGFAVRMQFKFHSDPQQGQIITLSVPWHRIREIEIFRTPVKGNPFFRIYLTGTAKRTQKGLMKNGVDDVSTVDILSPTALGVAQIAEQLQAICTHRGMKVRFRDSRLGR